MKKRIRLVSAILALLVIMSGMTFTASAISFTNGSTLGTGTITSAVNEDLTTDGKVTYSKAVYTDSESRQQAVYAMEFNPATSDYVPYVYSKYTGTGSGTYSSALKAESQFGVDVIGGVNATFYAMNTGSTYAGYWVHDGRLAQATVGYDSNIITFDSDGQVNIVKSKLDFKLYLDGKEITSGGGSGLVHINKKSLADSVSNGFYYWDTECGTKTDSVIAGLEILCKKLDYGQLSIGNTLKGEVLEVRKDSFYSAVGEDEFVLYVKNDSPIKASVEAAVAVGDIFEIQVNETVEESKQYTEKANTAMVAQYPIVKNGAVDAAESLSQLGAKFMNERAQRTSIGIKEDGSVVLICSAGRNITDSSPGLTVYELADIMVQLGCETAFNLDGGGSTTMVTTKTGSNDFDIRIKSNEGTYGRSVANSIYIVARQSVDIEISAALDQLITENEDSEAAAVVTAISEANAVIANTNSLTSDYTRAYMVLQSALSGKAELDNLLASVSSISFKNYSKTVLEMLWEAYDEAVAVRANNDATVGEIEGAINNLSTLLNMSGEASINISQGKSYVKLFNAYSTIANYDDTNGKELTDGNIGSLIINAYGPAWVGFHGSSKTGTEDGSSYYDTTIEFRKIESNLSKFVVNAEHDWGAGIEAPLKVVVSVSDDGTTFTQAGLATCNITNLVRSTTDVTDTTKLARTDVIYTLNLDEGVKGRYVKFHIVAGKTMVFAFVTEMQVFKSDSPITEGLYVTGFNEKILANYSIIFTPDYAAELTGDNANLNWARAISAQWDEELQNYVVLQTAQGNNGNVIKTVPENGFVLGVHGETDEGIVNKAYASTAKVGDIIVLHGIDIANKTLLAGSYITIKAQAGASLKPNATITLEGNFAKGIKENQTLTEIQANFNGSVIVKNKNGNVITGEAVVGTGSVIIVGTTNYTIVVKGDISGDGEIGSIDYLFAKRAFLGTITLTETQLKAACLGGTALPTSTDYLKIKRHFLGTFDIFA